MFILVFYSWVSLILLTQKRQLADHICSGWDPVPCVVSINQNTCSRRDFEKQNAQSSGDTSNSSITLEIEGL